jgi:predicted RNA-binding Zn-ribbon protein involved in translation (DUF1610 family)
MRRIGVQEYQRHASSHPMIGGIGKVREHIEHPVCPQCEKIALRGNGRAGSWTKERIAVCPSCGWSGRATMIMNEYLQEELYRR